MAYKYYTIKPGQKPTKKQIKEVQEASKRPIEFDEDCPELTAEQIAQFKKIAELKREDRRKQTVTVRISPQAMKKAKALGKGYTSVLGSILESALNDSEMIKKNL